MGLTFRIKNVGPVTRKMRQLPKRVQNAAFREIDQLAAKIRDEAIANAPRQTGNLANSIGTESSSKAERRVVVRVYADTAYAMFVELGTGMLGSSSNHPPLPEGYQHGGGIGRAAKPFLYPAFEKHRKEIVDVVKSSIRTSL